MCVILNMVIELCRHTLLMEAALRSDTGAVMPFAAPWHDTTTLQRLAVSDGRSLADRFA